MIGFTRLHLQPYVVTYIKDWRIGINSSDLVRTILLCNLNKIDIQFKWNEVKKNGVNDLISHKFIECKIGDIVVGIYPYQGNKPYVDYDKSAPRVDDTFEYINTFS